MNVLTDQRYYDFLMVQYEKELRASGSIVWLDASFYFNFAEWVEQTYDIRIGKNYSLIFKTEQDKLLFLLKWS